MNQHPIIEWLSEETETEPYLKENLINGIIHRFKLSKSEAIDWMQTFWKKYPKREENITTYDPEIHELINWDQISINPNKSMYKCKHCKRELLDDSQTYCNDNCKQGYINNIILFWKPEIVTELKDKSIENIQFESRSAFMTLVRDADPDELRIRIKVLKSVLTEAIEVAYSILDRDRIKAETESELSLKGVSRRDAANRSRELVEGAEKQREIDKIRKSGERIAKSGECRVCATKSVKEFCSDNCKQSWKTYLNLRKQLNDDEAAWNMIQAMVKVLEKPTPTENIQ